jgi:AraC family transcriptional regulator, regulatory protein of adaptative response / DNA-3-methyladenine glycosylase II
VIELGERLAYRGPLESTELLAFFARRAIPGVEQIEGRTYRRSVRLARGPAILELAPGNGSVAARYLLADRRDRDQALAISRTLLDLDTDLGPIVAALGEDLVIGARVRAAPGRRVAGTADPHELTIRAVLGQQISLDAARTLTGRLVAACGEQLEAPVGTVTHVFPTMDAVASADPAVLAMPGSRRSTVLGLARALAAGELTLDGADRAAIEAALLAVPGVGPWTVAYISMRALGDRDAFPAADLGIRRAMTALGERRDPAAVAERWRPYRAYAAEHLWSTLRPTGSR